MTHRDGLPRFSVSGLYQLNCTHTIAFPVSSAGGEAQAMAAHRQAFPTPRGATGGCPPDTVCGGRPRDPRGDGKSDPKGGVARLPGGQGGCPPGYGMYGMRGTPPRPPASSRAACGARHHGATHS